MLLSPPSDPDYSVPTKIGKARQLPLVENQQPSFMSEIDIQIPTAFDPFADANAEDSGAGTKEYVHVRIQQRNGRKSLTTVQGLKKEFSYNKILKDLKKEFCCNGTVVQDPELGQVIQLQGDQRKNVSTFLVQAGIVKKEHIKIHEPGSSWKGEDLALFKRGIGCATEVNCGSAWLMQIKGCEKMKWGVPSSVVRGLKGFSNPDAGLEPIPSL
ncbi:hypothetical protein ACLOJK_039434 [Asimina triloba]